MYLTVKQKLKHLSKGEYKILRKLCHISKNLRNLALYEIRQEFFNNKKYLNYGSVYNLLKKDINYKLLNSNVAQHIIKQVDIDFRSFFVLLSRKHDGKLDFKVNIPHYLPKDGFSELIIQDITINDNVFQVPYSRLFIKTHEKVYIKMPPCLRNKKVKEVKIRPLYNARYFEISYTYEVEDIEEVVLNNDKALAIDLGVDNLCTCVTSDGEAFIVDGRRLKSINQWYNKENTRLSSIKDKQKYGYALTKKQVNLTIRRANRIRDYLGKTAKRIVMYCINNNIGNLVFGKNKNFSKNSNIGRVNNQVFRQIPYLKLQKLLECQCKLNGINFIEQEESYTSKASFWDKDPIPVLGDENIPKFSGKRIKRGLYKTADGTLINADVNGALNILRKSNVVSLEALYSRGELNTPIRIRVA